MATAATKRTCALGEFVGTTEAVPVALGAVLRVFSPTILWTSNPKKLKAGASTISSAKAEGGAACEQINLEPSVMSDVIAPTNAPILLFRSPSYACSFVERLGGL